jgi:hypothetical protein
MKIATLVAAMMIACPALAEDWKAVQECARMPIPDLPNEQYPKPGDENFIQKYDAYAKIERDGNHILACRQSLADHHSGWIAATDKPDPFPPEPFMRDDDFPHLLR